MASVLIVDDDESMCETLLDILEDKGYGVVIADGAEALEIFVQLNPKPDIILMDHRMPVMNGTTATRELLHMDSSARILFISADETVKSEAMEAGALGFLTKPIRSKDLFSAIEAHMPS